MPAAKPPFRRLLANYAVNNVTGCWEWTGHKYPNGYGVIKVFGRDVSAHRYSYELHKGPIPHGLHILHRCDNKKYINPEHLRVGTHAENLAEAGERGCMKSGPDHHMYGRRNPRPNQANPVRVLGRVFESQKSAERAFGLGSGTVRYWLKSKPEKAQLLNQEN